MMLSKSTRTCLLKERLKKSMGPRAVTWARTRLKNKSFYHDGFHEKKLIFIHVPKSAGTSLGESIFNCGRTGHFEWTYYKLENPIAFEKYYKFSFVRHPVSRFVSAYNYLLNGGKSYTDLHAGRDIKKYGGIDDFIYQGLLKDGWGDWVHFRTQSSFIMDGADKMVDFIGKTERFSEDLGSLSEITGLNIKSITANEGPRKLQDNTSISEKSKLVIREIYHDDFRNFGYTI